MHRNGGIRNNTEWDGSTPLPFVLDNVAPIKSTIKCKVDYLYLNATIYLE